MLFNKNFILNKLVQHKIIRKNEIFECGFCQKCLNCTNFMIKVILNIAEKRTKTIKNDNKIYIMRVISGIGGVDAKQLIDEIFNLYIKIFSKLDNININYDMYSIIFTNYKLFFLLKEFETCIYKIIRISPFSDKKQTSIIAISYQQIESININLNMDDIIFTYTRSSGAGGQNVNKTNSCVIAKHVLTNLSVKVSKERTQFQNKKIAIEQLSNKIKVQKQFNINNIKKNQYTNRESISIGGKFNRLINLHKDKYISINYDVINSSNKNKIKFIIDKIDNIPILKIILITLLVFI